MHGHMKVKFKRINFDKFRSKGLQEKHTAATTCNIENHLSISLKTEDNENYTDIYRVYQEECARLREGVPYVKVYRYNPKHLCPKLNGYGDNGQRGLKL